ncbi:MAG: hypothetical protein ACIARR_11605 [Phycisphaerales bacterium JB059]
MADEVNRTDTRIAPGFRRRLSYYLFGIAIGLLMLGLINQARQRAVASRGAGPAPSSEPGGEPPTGAPESPSP